MHTSLASGGIEAMICNLSNELVKKCSVSLCTIFEVRTSDVFESVLSNQVKRYSLGKHKPGFSMQEIFKIYSFIKKGKYDVVHIHGNFYYYMLSILFLHKRVKFFYTIHNDAEKENTLWDKRLFYIKKYCFKHNLVYPITISAISQNSFYSLYGINSRLIYNGIKRSQIDATCITSINKYRITKYTKVFFHAARITEQKNQLVLCQVFSKLINEGYDVVLLIAGAIQDKQIYNSIRTYFCDRIQYIGERSDVVSFLHFSDAMCLPSTWEGLPIVLLEALSVGCIPVCSPVGGIINVVEDLYNGILSENSTASSYYSAIIRYLSLEEDMISDIKENCLASFKNFDIEKTANEYFSYYAEILYADNKN